eukprot:m.233217 g.233217  ORF g.233217 m.233217 type:complete len:330 (+) comp12479_c0_seq1:109-1098(+)
MATTLVLAALAALACAQDLPHLNIDKTKIITSGVSSGGAMAIQMHVAYSSIFAGVGIYAAPPYWCAQSDVEIALSSCMKDASLISVKELVDATSYAFTVDSIDDPQNLKNDNVWIFSGIKDTVVQQAVVNKTREYYLSYVFPSQLVSVTSLPAEHSWVTSTFGNTCDFLGIPYINNCNYDGPGSMLRTIYNPSLAPPASNGTGQLNIFTQKLYTPDLVYPHEISMGDSGYIYIPKACESGVCGLHVVFHGCNQDLETIGDVFVRHSGMNEYADTNNFIILYPQARKSPDVPYNPQGCWDWWGYTGLDYAVRAGSQMKTVHNMIAQIAGV